MVEPTHLIKYDRQIGSFPQGIGVKIKTSNLKPPPSDVWSYLQIMVASNSHWYLATSWYPVWPSRITISGFSDSNPAWGTKPLGASCTKPGKKTTQNTGVIQGEKDWLWKCLFYFLSDVDCGWTQFSKKMPHEMFITHWSSVPDSWYMSEKLIWILKWARKKDPLTFHYTGCFIRYPYIGLW